MKTTEFILHITVASDATLGDANIADLLKKTADTIAFVGIPDNTHMNLRDLNGNVVGRFGRYTWEKDDETPSCTQRDHDEAEWDGDGNCDRCGKPRQLPV